MGDDVARMTELVADVEEELLVGFHRGRVNRQVLAQRLGCLAREDARLQHPTGAPLFTPRVDKVRLVLGGVAARDVLLTGVPVTKPLQHLDPALDVAVVPGTAQLVAIPHDARDPAPAPVRRLVGALFLRAAPTRPATTRRRPRTPPPPRQRGRPPGSAPTLCSCSRRRGSGRRSSSCISLCSLR